MRVAAIDIGTNSCHLLIAEVSPEGQISVVEKAREQVELGAGEFAHQQITEEAFSRGISALSRFKDACDSFEVEDIHAAATSAVREAANGADFCRAVKQQTDIHVRVISGIDEARLIYLGARADIDFTPGRAMIFDLGGGSTEFVLCDSVQSLVLDSLPLGHIRLSDAFVRTDPISDGDRRALRSHIQSLLQPVLARVRPGDFTTLVGTSGTVRALALMATLSRGDAAPEHEHGLLLRTTELDELIRTFRSRPSSQWQNIPGFDPKRKRTIVAGALLIREILRALNKDQVISSERSLRDGLIVDWILRHRPELDISRSVPDPRRRAVLTMLNHYGADRIHARLVADFALQVFDATAPLHGLSIDDRRILEFGAMLHDIGHHISGNDHHRHSQYLIRHTPMPGFTSPEIALLGNLVRYHRGGKPKEKHQDYASLSGPDRKKVRLLSAILRLSDALDRGHNQNVVHLDVSLDPQGLQLRAITRDSSDLERWALVQRFEHLETELGVPISVELTRREAT